MSIGIAIKLLEHNFENFTVRGHFSKKTKEILNIFSGIVNSGRHNSAMITNCPKFINKIALHGMSSFSLYR